MPGPLGRGTVEVVATAYADDLTIFLRGFHGLAVVGPIMEDYHLAAGAATNWGPVPKKHKDAAAVAHQAWKRLKALRGQRLYLQHAHWRHPRDGGWLREAGGLALRGKRGTYEYAEDVS